MISQVSGPRAQDRVPEVPPKPAHSSRHCLSRDFCQDTPPALPAGQTRPSLQRRCFASVIASDLHNNPLCFGLLLVPLYREETGEEGFRNLRKVMP